RLREPIPFARDSPAKTEQQPRQPPHHGTSRQPNIHRLLSRSAGALIEIKALQRSSLLFDGLSSIAQTQARPATCARHCPDSPMVDQETADEIAQVERELEILRSRQALIARWDRRAALYLAIAVAGTPPLLAVLVYIWTADLFMATFIIVMTLLVAILLWIGTRTSDRLSSVPLVPLRKLRPPLRKLRPSQFLPLGASMSPLGFRGLGFSFGGPGYKSDEETLEDMVALREKRLAELKGGPPPSVSGSARNSPRE